MTRLPPREESDFPANLFVVDPEGCGCTDCILGWSTPFDLLSVENLLEAVLMGLRLVDRRGPS